jgi:outer membrane protein, heavy metal efflux system
MTLVAVAVVVVCWAPAHAQAPVAPAPPTSSRFADPVNGLSLEEAIARALEREPSLRAARSQIDVARGDRLQAGLRPNPSVAFERRGEPRGSDSLTMATVDWPLDVFSRPGRTAVADAQVAAASFAVADRERRLAADVRTRYGDVLVALRDLDVFESIEDATRRQRDVLASRVAEGASRPLDRDLLEVEVQRLEAERLLQVGVAEAALIELGRLLGMAVGTPLTVQDSLDRLVEREPASSPSNDAEAVSRRSDVREGETRVGLAAATMDLAQRDVRPALSVYGTYMRMNSGFPQLGFAANGSTERVHDVFHYLAGGVRVTLPIQNRNQGAVATAQAEQAGAQAALAATRLSADAELASAHARDERARAAVQVYRATLQALARQNLSVVQQSYDLGRLTLFDVLAEQRRYLDMERSYTRALQAAFESRTSVRLARGDVR